MAKSEFLDAWFAEKRMVERVASRRRTIDRRALVAAFRPKPEAMLSDALPAELVLAMTRPKGMTATKE